LSRISFFKARNLTPKANAAATSSSTQRTQNTQQKTASIANDDFVLLYDLYHTALSTSNLLDYDDLLLHTLQLLKSNPKCISNISAVLIDEFQDTNTVQYSLMLAFSSACENITIVGDPDQSIYGFRAAEIKNIPLMAAHFPGCLRVNLEENYRSSASILQAALVVIQQDLGRIDKPLLATHGIGPPPVLRRVTGAKEEAEWIVQEVKRIRAVTGNMIPLDGFAILVRSAHLTRLIETALTRGGVAYKMVGGTRFYDRAEVKTVVDYLRVMMNPANNDAVVRIINVPGRKIGETTIKVLLEMAEKKKKTLYETIHDASRGKISWSPKVTPAAQKSIQSFINIMEKAMTQLNEDEDKTTLVDILQQLLSTISYEHYLRSQYGPEDFEARWANIQELLFQAREASNPLNSDSDTLLSIDGLLQQQLPTGTPRASLDRFLSNAALSNERLPDPNSEPIKELTISTIHAAKGLEWPIVFIPAVYEGSIPHSRADDTDEERRLLYVAMTRAQGLLYLSCPWRGMTEKVKLSSFVDNSKITRLLAKRGPSLSFSNVQTLADILRLNCPTELQIEKTIEEAVMEGMNSRLDDRISDLDPAERDKVNAKYEGMMNVDVDGLRSDAAAADGRSLPGFQSARNLPTKAMIPAGEKAGFRTASNHLEELKRRKRECDAEPETETRREAVAVATTQYHSTTSTAKTTLKTTASKITARSTKRPPGQGTLMGFITTTSKPTTTASTKPAQSIPVKVGPRTATDIIKNTNTAPMSLKQQMASLPAPVIPKRPSDDFILLSSSPPPRKEKRSKTSTSHSNYIDTIKTSRRITQPKPPAAAIGGVKEVVKETREVAKKQVEVVEIPSSPIVPAIPSSPIFAAAREMRRKPPPVTAPMDWVPSSSPPSLHLDKDDEPPPLPIDAPMQWIPSSPPPPPLEEEEEEEEELPPPKQQAPSISAALQGLQPQQAPRAPPVAPQPPPLQRHPSSTTIAQAPPPLHRHSSSSTAQANSSRKYAGPPVRSSSGSVSGSSFKPPTIAGRPTGPASSTGRGRTLGVRRSMNGWNNRVHK
jgi:DNA helicase-2/ATP-dependent DNA helicase PcrA